MILGHTLLFLALLAPHAAVYVKGRSQAAARARAHLKAFTCYDSAILPKNSAATLEVSHMLMRSGYRHVVMVLIDAQGKVMWEGKAEEYPWPLGSPVDRLLKKMARSTCQEAVAEAAEKHPSPSSK